MFNLINYKTVLYVSLVFNVYDYFTDSGYRVAYESIGISAFVVGNSHYKKVGHLDRCGGENYINLLIYLFLLRSMCQAYITT